MNWFLGSKPKTNVSSQTNLQAHRAKQIDSLKKTNLNPIETIPNAEYRVAVQIGGNNVTLVISLPPQFPQDPPTVTVQPPIFHPWVDSQMKVAGCPNLNSFSMHSSLGQAVQSIVDEFKRNPPQMSSQGYNIPYSAAGAMPYQGYGSPRVMSGYPAPPTLPPIGSNSPVNHAESRPRSQSSENTESSAAGIPDVHTAFPELKNKSLSELNSMLNEEDKILEMIQKLPEVCRLAEDREKLSNECINLARENLSMKPSIVQLKQWITEKNGVFDKMMDEFERDQECLMSSSDQFHPTNIQTNLKVALMEAEEESENIVDAFMDKKMNIEEFTQKFMHTRMLCHVRRAKEEKLHQIILRQGYN